MKTERNILVAFILNLAFSIFEFIGGAITGSVAIISDAIHDIGDAATIGTSYFLERKSKKQPDETYTYGYARYSIIGGAITTLVLLLGSGIVIYNAVLRIFNPVEINYDGMIIFAVVGALVNLCAAYFTREGDSVNQRAVNLHMLEDVLGWIVVLLGAIIMRFTDISIIDPIMSIGVAVFIIINAIKNLKSIVELLLEKIPDGLSINEIKNEVCSLDGVKDVHHIHIWSMDGHTKYLTMHVVSDGDAHTVKDSIRSTLKKYGIGHATLEIEAPDEHCHEICCHVEEEEHSSHHHHHHHHHHH